MPKKSHHPSFEHDSIAVTIGERLGARHLTFRAVGVIATLVGAGYLVWRIFATQQGAHPVPFWVLWSAEAVGWLSLTLFVRDSWSNEATQALRGVVRGKVDILIPTFDEPISVLMPTIIGATLVRGDKTIWVLDDGSRDWVRDLARQHNVNYVRRETHESAKAGNINNVLPQLRGDFVLILDADHVPQRAIVDEMLGYFVDEKVAIVQSPHGFRNLDSVQHTDSRVNEQSLFFDVLLPGRGRSDAVFWCGSGAIIRTDALRSIGGIATTTITEDLETSIALQRAGWHIVYHNRILLQGLAPHNLESFLIQRYRWARGTLQILLSRKSPIFGKGFTMPTRLSYLSNLVYYLVPVQHIMFVLVLTSALAFGWLPVYSENPGFVTLWLVQMGLAQLAIWGLSAGRQIPFAGTRNAWTTSYVYVAAIIGVLTRTKASFTVTPKVGVDRGGWAVARLLLVPIVALITLSTVVIWRLVDSLLGLNFLNAIDPLGQVFLIGFAVIEMTILAPHVYRLVLREQVRAVYRLPVSLRAELSGIAATVVDLHESGARVLVHTSDISDLTPGQRYSLSIHLPGERDNIVFARLTPSRRMRRIGLDKWMVGGSIEWTSESSKVAAMAYCYVTNPESRLLR